jgi:hypothetical protein
LVAAALVSAYADSLGPSEVEPVGVDDAVGQAVESGDEHAIKLASACLGRPGALHPAVTAAVAQRLRRRR